MAVRTDALDLASLNLKPGEAKRLELTVPVGDFDFGGESYSVEPDPVNVVLDLSRMARSGWALRLRFEARLTGTCMRCLGPAAPLSVIDAREVDQPGGGEELESPYVEKEQLDLGAWTRDALALELPGQILCGPDCAGLCAVCGVRLADAEPGHAHEAEPDPRWAKLRNLDLDR